ncbi:MAG: hypothetical protein EPN57_04525 [Paraburkholderia sp.]|nr:MAG: hypothetical protein EPN57_04525 [Paraburkholderia sp.]
MQLIDGFLGEPLDDDAPVTFRLDGTPCTPLYKGSGFYVFMDLRDTSPHQVDVTCAGFTSVQTTLTAIAVPLLKPLAELIVVLELGPSPAYSYSPDATLLCGKVTSGRTPLGDVEVFALFSDRQGTWQWRKTRSYAAQHDSPYFGHYSLALPSSVSGAPVSLRFTKDGHTSHFERVAPTRSRTTIVGADLLPTNA